MTAAEIECLKDSIDRLVEIRTVDEECLTAKILFVIHCEEYDEHELIYEVVSSNKTEEYSHLESLGGYVLDFERIISVTLLPPPARNP